MNLTQLFDLVLGNAVTQIVIIVLVALLAQIFARTIIHRLARRLIRRHRYATELDEKKREDTLSSVFSALSGIVVWTIATIVGLSIMDVDVAALMTGAGLIGIVVGFGAQTTIKDLLAGIFIIAENQYRVGDIVTINASGTDVSGVVEEITMRITRLRDLSGNVHIVKNGSAEVITNLSFEYANVNIDLDVGYAADIDVVEKVINEVGTAMSAKGAPLSKHIFEPIQFLRVDSFEASSVRVKALGKVEPAKQWEVSGAFLREIKSAFEKHNIEIPFNQLVVHGSETTPKQ
jgi:small-conductance mechanosensitive channel